MSVCRSPVKNARSSRSGFTLIEVILAMAMAGFLVGTIAGALAFFSKQESRLSSRMSVTSVALNLRRMLSNDSALLSSIFAGKGKNSVFDCFRSPNLDPLNPTAAAPTGCKKETGTLDQLFNSSGQQVADFSDPNSGFTSTGEACSTYGVDPNCNIKARINVSYICDKDVPGQCLKPQIVMTGSLEIRDPETGSLTVLDNVFEVRKDWAAMTPNLVELGQFQSSNVLTGKTFKLVVIIDNSTSMATYQAKLSASLDPMLEGLRINNFNLAVQIYSTTQYMMGTAFKNKYPHPIESDQQILTLKSVSCTSKDGTRTESGFCGDVPLSGYENETWEMKAPTEVVLPASASDSDFLAFKTKILDTVKNMGVSGSDDEQGLCTFARLLKGANNFILPGDKVGVILIANENDSSTSAKCANEIKRYYAPNGRLQWSQTPRCDADPVVQPATDLIDYSVKVKIGNAGYKVEYTCQTYRDGGFVPYNPNDVSTYRATNANRPINEWVVDDPDPRASALAQYGLDLDLTCENSGINFDSTVTSNYLSDNVTLQKGDCPAAVRDKVARLSDCGYYKADGTFIGAQIVSCKVQCNNTINYGPTAVRLKVASPAALRQTSDLSKNFCFNPVDVGANNSYLMENTSLRQWKELVSGSTYPTATEIFKANYPTRTLWTPPPGGSNCCRIQSYRQPFPVESENQYTSIFPAELASGSIVDALQVTADNLLGKDSYFISTIIHTSDPSLACPMDANESTGFIFEELARKAQNSKVVPICATDYSAALEPLKAFIKNSETLSISGNDTIKLAQGSQVVQIYVVNDKMNLQFPIGGPIGVWPELKESTTDGKEKTYQLDFSKTGYALLPTDRVFAMVVNQDTSLSIGDIGGNFLSYDQIRSLYRLGLGH